MSAPSSQSSALLVVPISVVAKTIQKAQKSTTFLRHDTILHRILTRIESQGPQAKPTTSLLSRTIAPKWIYILCTRWMCIRSTRTKYVKCDTYKLYQTMYIHTVCSIRQSPLACGHAGGAWQGHSARQEPGGCLWLYIDLGPKIGPKRLRTLVVKKML